MCQCTPNKRTSFCGKGECKSPEQMQLIYNLNEFGRKATEFDKLSEKCLDPVVEAVRQDLLNRSHVGIVKYGTTLYDNMGDLRYWLQHSYEETLDKANYLKRAIMEIDRIVDDNK